MSRWDSHVVWEGAPASSRIVASYRLTRDALYIHVGGPHATDDLIPLAIVEGADVSRSLPQRVRGVADVKLSLDRDARPLQPVATLADLEDAERVRDTIVEQADRVRRNELVARLETQAPVAPRPERPGTNPDLPVTQQLRELAALHDAEVITDDEFARLKARLIDPD